MTPLHVFDWFVPNALSNEQHSAWEIQLQNCNKLFSMPFLVYEHGDHFELTANVSVLKDISQQYTACPVTAFFWKAGWILTFV